MLWEISQTLPTAHNADKLPIARAVEIHSHTHVAFVRYSSLRVSNNLSLHFPMVLAAPRQNDLIGIFIGSSCCLHTLVFQG